MQAQMLGAQSKLQQERDQLQNRIMKMEMQVHQTGVPVDQVEKPASQTAAGGASTSKKKNRKKDARKGGNS